MTQKCKAADESFIGGDEKKGKHPTTFYLKIIKQTQVCNRANARPITTSVCRLLEDPKLAYLKCANIWFNMT